MKNTSLNLKNFFSWFEMNPNECDDEIMKKLKYVISDNEGEMIQQPNQKNLNNENESRINQNEHFCIFDKCKKKFVTENELKDHYLLHMTSKSFKCEFRNCEKIYKSKENLVLHIKNIHMKLKPYRCRFCDASFSHRNGKTYHERKFHINYLPYKCNLGECTASFASKSALNTHLNSKHKINKNFYESNKEVNIIDP